MPMLAEALAGISRLHKAAYHSPILWNPFGGGGSYPPRLKGLHLKMRKAAMALPKRAPWVFTAS
jgi:hypothetical protein